MLVYCYMGTIKHSEASKKRTGKTPEERSLYMSNLAKKKWEKMGDKDRVEHLKKMSESRWKK